MGGWGSNISRGWKFHSNIALVLPHFLKSGSLCSCFAVLKNEEEMKAKQLLAQREAEGHQEQGPPAGGRQPGPAAGPAVVPAGNRGQAQAQPVRDDHSPCSPSYSFLAGTPTELQGLEPCLPADDRPVCRRLNFGTNAFAVAHVDRAKGVCAVPARRPLAPAAAPGGAQPASGAADGHLPVQQRQHIATAPPSSSTFARPENKPFAGPSLLDRLLAGL